jgi:hypothetical protein
MYSTIGMKKISKTRNICPFWRCELRGDADMSGGRSEKRMTEFITILGFR